MPRGKRKHTSKLIDDEPFYEPPIKKNQQKKYYFKCETEIGVCMFVYTGYTLEQAIRKLRGEVKVKTIKHIKEKILN